MGAIGSYVVVNMQRKQREKWPYLIHPCQYERTEFPYRKPVRVNHYLANRAMRELRGVSVFTTKDWLRRYPEHSDMFIGRSQGIGDILMLTPALRVLKEEGWKITLAVMKQFMPIVRNNPYVHRVVPCKPNQMPHTDITNKINLNLKVERVRGKDLNTPRSKLFAQLLSVEIPDEWKHPTLVLSEADYEVADELVGSGDWITIPAQTSTTWRNYPRTEELIFRLAERGRKVAVIHHSTVFNDLDHPNILDLQGKISSSEMCAVIGKSLAVISPDTGPMHVAMTLKTPCVALEGPMPAKIYHWNYDSSPKAVMEKDLPCIGCGHKGRYARFGCKESQHQCMDFEPDEIIDTMDRLVDSKTSINVETVQEREPESVPVARSNTSELWSDD